MKKLFFTLTAIFCFVATASSNTHDYQMELNNPPELGYFDLVVEYTDCMPDTDFFCSCVHWTRYKITTTYILGFQVSRTTETVDC